ncbi:MAG: hypothetical protein CVU57_23765 [Deltaproteobacteria bacterium HGW-Deltaproteobacteria-15]|jgi:hypothetical protein|nr:MAG: hypothetical protein CVU57_23765 [Deltaproteobacteria bacterium HGW-Deltaproteobacteria-15]PKO02348.1 MAG: hypothetical protein CVU43_08300 [Chloroflexi bacterium HGW-Chloroflexi-5]
MNFIKYVYSNVLIRVFTFSSKNHLPWLAAMFFPLYTRRVKRAVQREKTYKLLVIPKEGLDEDVLASFGRDQRFAVFAVYRKVMKALASGLLHPSLEDNNYISDQPEVEASKKGYRSFMKDLWRKLQAIYGFDAVLSGNFSYYADREFGAALEDLGVPFIVLHKENLKSPGRVEFYMKLYRERRGQFLGSKIFVYNEIEKSLQIEAGIAAPMHVIVTGMPRLDRIHKWRESRGGRSESARGNHVLFFAFGPKTGLPSIPRKPRAGILGGYERIGDGLDELEWTELFRECHYALLRLAYENPDIKVVVKGKGNLTKSSRLYQIFNEKKMPPNFEIAVGGDPFEMIIDSNVVCGINTTGLFEALAAGKPVVVPRFAEALGSGMQAYIVDMEDSVEYASSPDDLVAKLKKHAKGRLVPSARLSEETMRMLEKWTGNSDGLSGTRVRNALLKEIEARSLPFRGGQSG